MANQGGNNVLMRDYRKGNWTLQETMVLIEAKKMDDERRMKRQGDSASERSGKPAELRWKWVEDYCWRNNCLRSQNQCNDKWDNLIRDFKKVREYERRLAEQNTGSERAEKSYWKLEKNGRKAKNLPSNMLPEIYEALVEVVERKGQRGMVGFAGAGTGGTASTSKPNVSSSSAAQPLLLPPIQHHPISTPVPALPLPPAPAVAQTPVQLQHSTLPFPQQLPTVDSDTSEHSDSPAKRRRRGEGTSGGVESTGTTRHDVGTAISRSASVIAEAIQACEEREERRHKELLSLHERRLQIEESKAEITRQGINGMVDAVNKLANSILSLADHKSQSTPK